MSKHLWRAAAVGATAALLALVTPPAANAVGPNESALRSGTGVTPAIRDGVDFDAGCLINPTAPPPSPNHYRSGGPAKPGCSDQAGHAGVSIYDGKTESTDIASVDLTSYTAGGEDWLKATVVIDGKIPAAGTVVEAQSALDTPNAAFKGIGLKVMWTNKDKQHNGDNPSSGCITIDGRKQRDQHGHWKDGWQFFTSFDVTHDGQGYVHAVSVGEYDPTPDGAFFFDELGVNDGTKPGGGKFDHTGAVDDDPFQPAGARWKYSVRNAFPKAGQTTVTVETTGLVRNADDLCASGFHTTDMGSNLPGKYSPAATYTGDRLVFIKGLSTANQVVVLPVTVPLSASCDLSGGEVCLSDLTSVGGFIFFSDTTAGGSTAGRLFGDPTAPAVNIEGIAYSGGALGITDTLGESQTCPTPTFGGLLPNNPLWLAAENQSCEIDDDAFGRGALLSEWWDTPFTWVM